MLIKWSERRCPTAKLCEHTHRTTIRTHNHTTHTHTHTHTPSGLEDIANRFVGKINLNCCTDNIVSIADVARCLCWLWQL